MEAFSSVVSLLLAIRVNFPEEKSLANILSSAIINEKEELANLKEFSDEKILKLLLNYADTLSNNGVLQLE